MKCCGTCVYARFEYTPTKKIKKSTAGHCLYKVPDDAWPPLPYAMTSSYCFRLPVSPSSNGIQEHDGVECPVYKSKD